MRPVNVPLEDLAKTVLSIGFLGENMHTQVLFDCKKLYEEYPSAVPALTVKPPEGDPYPAITTMDDGIVTWDIRDTDLTHDGNGEIQLTFTVDEVVAKSYIGKTRVSRSIMPTGDIPDSIDNWITEANTVLNAVPQTIEDDISNKMGEITAEAETLATGEDATASYDPETKVFTFGIPEGQQGEGGLVARFYPSIVAFPCDSDRKHLIQSTATVLFEVLRGSERVNATFLEDHTTTETTLKYYNMDWWVPEQCTPGHPGTLKIYVPKDTDPFSDRWSRDALIAPCVFHLENSESVNISLTLVCTREGKDGQDGSALIDDTAGTGDTDKAWSANKLVSEFAGKMDDIGIATEAETSVIISEYDNSGALIAEMEFYTDGEYDVGFKTILDADEIAEAVTSGKRVLLHIPNVSDEPSYYPVNDEAYLEVIGYMPAYTFENAGSGTTQTSPANFIVTKVLSNISNYYDSQSGLEHINGTKIDSNGKLCLTIYVD